VILTIDTTHPLNDTDRAVLRSLLERDAPTAGHQPSHTGPRPNSAAAVAAGIGAGMPTATGRQTGVPASARLAVAAQPGVSFTESTAEEDPNADR
jgi:hypothetical protein